ncbi:hypothetical protein [Paenibacillus tarimensis]|uniref:hypothetical protein n=1 Tax=Paenibacillus tarimensis TaxID=416012 RepID=UPI001F3EDE84|nr:hypothetical protein [Paenibacillus tarimensis]MCF2944320.1 hypothetical protein [Paenibacillus tarimensis]
MNELLTIEGTLTPLSSKTHITYQFHIDEPPARLAIEFQYSPKVLEDSEISRPLIMEAIGKYVDPSAADLQKQQWERFTPLQNLLTLSVDDPEGFRGSAHRHPPEQRHTLAVGSASPGFIPGVLPAGIWRITISVHCVVTPACTYRLSVYKGRDAE